MMESRLSSELWTIRLKPSDDELLSSWLTRLASAHGTNVLEFTRAVWPETRWWLTRQNYDVDRRNERRIFDVLSAKTVTSYERTIATSLTSLDGRLFETPLSGPIPWLLPCALSSAVKRFGLQFCPWCLRDDEQPYFRRVWRLAFTVFCPKHNVMLSDRCPECGDPVNYHGRMRGLRSDDPLESAGINFLIQCRRCDFDLRRAADAPSHAAEASEIEFQKHLMDVLRLGWADVPGSGAVHSLLYFNGVRSLLSLVTRKSHAGVRAAVARHFGVETFEIEPNQIRPVEMSDVATRRRMLTMVERLLRNWPDGFVDFCKTNRFRGKTLGWARGRHVEPFWYRSVVDEQLTPAWYVVSDEEFRAAYDYVIAKGLSPVGAEIAKFFNDWTVSERVKTLELRLPVSPREPKPGQSPRQCPHCGATRGQRRSSWGRPHGNYKYHCTMCGRYNIPDPIKFDRRIPDSVRDETRRLYASGVTKQDIASQLSRSYNWVTRTVQGVSTPPIAGSASSRPKQSEQLQ